MSRNKGDLVFTDYYEPHLRGQSYKNNPVNNQQALTQRMYQRILTELCANRFKWEGLPDSVDRRFLEMELFYQAMVIIYKDEKITGELLAVKGSGAGYTNFNDNPVSFTVIGSNMQSKQLTANECVPIYANYLRCPDLDIVLLYSRKLAKIDRSIEINIDGMRYSKVLTVEENQRLSYMNLLRQHDEGQPFLLGTSALNPENVTVLDVGVPSDAVANLQIAKSKLWNECMGLLGINNANQDKKERLVSAEVGANDEQVDATRAIALNARQFACEEINRMFHLNVSVSFGDKETVDGEIEDESKDKKKAVEK